MEGTNTVTIPQDDYYQLIKNSVVVETIERIMRAGYKYDSDTIRDIKVLLGMEAGNDE